MLALGAYPNFCLSHLLSITGRCATFDASADGYCRGEGCGAFVLETETPPQHRPQAMYCGVNQDGRSATLTAPSGPSQQALLREALLECRIQGPEVSECLGTGTALGDPIEVGALRHVLRASNRPLVLRSTKTNFGHLEGAAGIAGLMTCLQLLAQRCVPPNLHLTKLNPHLEVAACN